MKRKLLVIALACVFALALPCMAFATDSEVVKGDTTTSTGIDDYGNKAELKFTAEGADWVKVVPSDSVAGNYNMDGKTVVAEKSYEITASKENVKVTLVYTTDEKFAGLTCYVFVEHADGTFETFVKPVGADGTVTVTMDKLSTVTFSISNEKYEDVAKDDTEKASTSKGGSTTTKAVVSDSKSTSPKTGVVA